MLFGRHSNTDKENWYRKLKKADSCFITGTLQHVTTVHACVCSLGFYTHSHHQYPVHFISNINTVVATWNRLPKINVWLAKTKNCTEYCQPFKRNICSLTDHLYPSYYPDAPFSITVELRDSFISHIHCQLENRALQFPQPVIQQRRETSYWMPNYTGVCVK